MEMFLAAVLCYGIGILTVFAPHHMQIMAHYVANVAAVLGSGLVFFNSWAIIAGDAPVKALRWGNYVLTCDNWSAVFLMITGLAGIIASIYALGYAESYEGKRLRILNGLWNMFIASMVLVLLAGDALSFLLFWEIMAVASFLLVNHEAEKRTTWNAAYQYLVMTSIGTAAIMIAFFLTCTHSDSFAFADMAANTLKGGWLHATFAAAFIGFALKAGLVPLHVWLPNAHPAAPSHVSALMSGVMLKIALYGFGRFMLDFLSEWNYWWAVIVMVVGLVSAFLGVLYAQMEVDIKRVLAYSSVENMGIIFAAFGCGMLLKVVTDSNWCQIGFLAALMHAFNHSIMKVLMFMSAGSIMHGTGSKNLELFGGLAKKMPYTALFTFVGAMGLAALPLTNGFVGEWMVLQGFITLAHNGLTQDVRLLTVLAFVLMGLTGALALGCFVRYFGITVLGAARNRIIEHAHESDVFMLTAMGISSVLVLLVGVFPAYVIELLCKAINMSDYMVLGVGGQLVWSGSGTFVTYNPIIIFGMLGVLGVAVLCFVVKQNVCIQKDVVWNCGTYPTARQQYSATGFSKPVRRAFDYLLKPKRERTFTQNDHSYFGRKLFYKLEIPDMISEKLYQPFNKYFVSASAFLRRLQQGSVRLYVSYVMVAMVIVLVWGAMYK